MKEDGKMKKRDMIFICAILVFAGVLFAVFSFTRNDGACVIVRVDGEEIARCSLKYDGEYILNNGTNILYIKDGRASLHNSKCPDKLCERFGEICKNGETITCLPNKLTVTVYGGDGGDVELVG